MSEDCPTGKYSFGQCGKGSRPRTYGNKYADGYDSIDWSKKITDVEETITNPLENANNLTEQEDQQSTHACEPPSHCPQPTGGTDDTGPQKAPSC